MNRTVHVVMVASALLLFSPSTRAGGGDEKNATVAVECTRSSALIELRIENHRRIGAVELLIIDANGRTLYHEEGKAMTGELVRMLDKGLFPKGEHQLSVKARDFSITQRFAVQ
ncbi:MAG: hypothetical protein IPK99_01115 [Flavobacteriales bacterium]|nr:hypothetical protein [Flavobacteriales bacterium]